MKIGLLTYHHVSNLGSILQTYAGTQVLARLYPGAHVELIDYEPEASRRYRAAQRRPEKKGWKMFGGRPADIRDAYAAFLAAHCRMSPYSIRSDDLNAAMATIEAQDYDAVFVGSDTVFQMDGYLGHLIAGPQAPNCYFLPGLTGPKKIGLAVSVDPYRPQDLTPDREPGVRRALKGFDAILYRDEMTRELLTELGVAEDRMGHSPDPTILVDFASFASSSDSTFGEANNKVGVSIGSKTIRQHVIDILKARGHETINLFRHSPESVEAAARSASLAPLLSRYLGLSGLVTDRFHGSILALHMGDYPVVGIEDSDVYKMPNGKLRDLYRRLGIESRLIRCSEGVLSRETLWDAWEAATEPKAEILARLSRLRHDGYAQIAKVFPDLGRHVEGTRA